MMFDPGQVLNEFFKLWYGFLAVGLIVGSVATALTNLFGNNYGSKTCTTN